MPEIAANSSAVVKMDGEFMIFEAKISFAAMGIKAVNSEYFGLNVLDDTTWSMWTVGGESSIGFWQTTRCTGKAVLTDSNASSIEGKTDPFVEVGKLGFRRLDDARRAVWGEAAQETAAP